MKKLWILGAPDPEMEKIEKLLDDVGEDFGYAMADGRRVHPGSAYRADSIEVDGRRLDRPPGGTKWIAYIECAVCGGLGGPEGGPWKSCVQYCAEVVIDHHRPGDPGYGRPPREFLAASSIGQVLGVLDIEIPERGYILAAAADHCLGAAYRGECPGVDPDELMAWRVRSRATFQGRDPEELLRDVEATRKALHDEPLLDLGDGVYVRDMRRDPPYPELPEAGTREGVGYVAGPLKDRSGRRKITCSGMPEHIEAFMSTWAPEQGLVDIYGDPARGFAGGYEE